MRFYNDASPTDLKNWERPRPCLPPLLKIFKPSSLHRSATAIILKNGILSRFWRWQMRRMMWQTRLPARQVRRQARRMNLPRRRAYPPTWRVRRQARQAHPPGVPVHPPRGRTRRPTHPIRLPPPPVRPQSHHFNCFNQSSCKLKLIFHPLTTGLHRRILPSLCRTVKSGYPFPA